ncbi:hypothetical protein [Amycolatopsis sp. NPDC051128]|uniref:hypothetical protein n=1 Tax=Amycolatopsis sp. NPDC051128 TaxID=3155412 RepID=UPI003412113E
MTTVDGDWLREKGRQQADAGVMLAPMGLATTVFALVAGRLLSRGRTVDPATGFGWASGVLGAVCALGSVATPWLRRAERSSTVDVRA